MVGFLQNSSGLRHLPAIFLSYSDDTNLASVHIGMIFACLSAGKGVANLCSGPLSEALLRAGSWRAGSAYGSGYGALIAFTGATALLSGWSYAAKKIGWF